jgi:hypothetical protein
MRHSPPSVVTYSPLAPLWGVETVVDRFPEIISAGVHDYFHATERFRKIFIILESHLIESYTSLGLCFVMQQFVTPLAGLHEICLNRDNLVALNRTN